MILIKNLNSLHLFKLLFYLGYKDGDTYKMTDDTVTKAAQSHNLVSWSWDIPHWGLPLCLE